MAAESCDVLVVGKGLAGTALAWQLLKLGQRVIVVDPGEECTSSRIAAGLVTPLTGRKILLSWRYAEFLSTAVEFYRSVEEKTGSRIFELRPHWRILSETAELAAFNERCRERPEMQDFLQLPAERLAPEWFGQHPAIIQMRQAGQLQTTAYLEASCRLWQEQGIFWRTRLQADEIEVRPDRVRIPRLNLESRHVIFCQGAADRENPWFPQIRFLAAKGEILTLEPAVPVSQIVHAGIWLGPGAGQRLLAGATYNSQQLDSVPTAEGREEILSRLKRVVRFPFDVVGQRAAVRPALHDQKPVVGLHPRFPSLGILNGLGSKGALQAPWLAEHLACHLVLGTPLDAEIDLRLKYPVD